MGEMELDAMANTYNPDSTKAIILSDMFDFYNRSKTLDPNLPALGYLLLFSHIARISFHRNPPVLGFYQNHSKSIMNVPKQPNQISVSIHMRRADSCGHQRSGYETTSSALDSIAQVSGKRMCYATSVYLEALRRIQKESGRPVDVYLATDDAGFVIDEIQKDFDDLYKSMNWHYLDYSRDTFRYKGFVEGDEIESAQHAMIGESAVADLWHLSHGEVFIGHMGSRFCKMGWALATGRRNTFVPFFTVDGHSFCCEIDENCASMKPYITGMDSCMAWASELSPVQGNTDYWEVGSMKRKIEAEMQQNKSDDL